MTAEKDDRVGDAIRSCPFCATADQLEVVEVRAAGTMLNAIACGHCGARGPLQASAEDAAEVWNARLGTIEAG